MRTALDAYLGRILDDGDELELLGGLNFIGFVITPNTVSGYYSLTPDMSAVDYTDADLAGLNSISFGPTAAATAHVNVGAGDDGAAITVIAGLAADGLSTIPLFRWGAFGDNILAIGTTTTLASIYMRSLTSQLWTIGSMTMSATANAVAGLDLTGVAKIDSATVAAPVEGAQITTTATINVGQGNNRTVTAAGGAYAITLHASTGSPYTGEVISLVCSNALANAVTVTNGGAGGGNIGPSGGTLPSGAKLVADFKFDGTNWALAGVKRIS